MTTPSLCGTYPGFAAHRRAGEPACRPCRAARQRYEKRRLADQQLGRPRMVDATGTRRRLQALVAFGWTYPQIGEHLGVSGGAVYRLLTRTGPVQRRVAAKVTTAYRTLAVTPPPAKTRTEKRNVAYARTVARQHGWPSPAAWDDDIDDPSAAPRIDGDTHGTDVDPVVVQRILAGDWRLPATHAERVEVAQRWTGGRNELERLTGWNVRRDARQEAKAA